MRKASRYAAVKMERPLKLYERLGLICNTHYGVMILLTRCHL